MEEEETNERGHNLYQGIEEEMEIMQKELEQGIEKDSNDNRDKEELERESNSFKPKQDDEEVHEQNEEEERRPYHNEFKLISRDNSPKSHKSEESKSMDFGRLKGNVIKSVLISAGKSSVSSNKHESNNVVEQQDLP